MTSPYFPRVGPDNKLYDKHLPQRLQPADLNETIQDVVGSMFPGGNYNDTLGTITLPTTSLSSDFADVRLGTGDGVTVSQTVAAGSFTTVTLNAENSDTNDRFNPTTYLYTCASSGLYTINARIRVVDTQADGRNVGIGVHTSNVDGAWFQWFKVSTAGTGGRWTAGYTRTAIFTAGSQLRLYCYSDSGTFPINTAGMTVVYLGS